MAHGVEMRAPLLDRRIVEFALRRPRSERASLGEVKRLLRGAGRDLLPESVLTPRQTRTGMLTGYFRRSFMEDANGLIESTFRQPVLADIGVVDRDALLRAWHEYRNGGSGFLGGMLFATLHTELWVRARLFSGDVLRS
jgi:asparagine synthase (glutamine-hydrolysing)